MKTGTIFNCNPGGNLGWQPVITQTGTWPGHTYSLPKELWAFKHRQEAGRQGKPAVQEGGEVALTAPQRPLTKLWPSASCLRSWPFLTCHTRQLPHQAPLLPPVGSNPSGVIRHLPFKVVRLQLLQSRFLCSVLSVSVCPVCLASGSAASPLSRQKCLSC